MKDVGAGGHLSPGTSYKKHTFLKIFLKKMTSDYYSGS